MKNSINKNPGSGFNLQFLGGAGTVTGSKFLLSTPDIKILIDCGLFQGIKPLRLRNWNEFPVDPSSIDVVIITHAHLDHTGYLPVLFRNGFRGLVLMTHPTKDLAKLILFDSAHIQTEQAEHANLGNYTRHHPAIPLYNVNDVTRILNNIRAVDSGEWNSLSSEISFRFRKNGHILGSAFIELKCQDKLIVFSGDIGRKKSFSLHAPESPERADYLVLESTYGNRLHPDTSIPDEMSEIINNVISKKGNLLIPSFAVGRSQELMLIINELKATGKVPDIPVYLDTPMGINATEIYKNHPDWHKLTPEQCRLMCREIHQVRHIKESREILKMKGSKIIIAASGMLTGGRVLHYLERYLENPANTILLSGYQAEGTRGRALIERHPELKMFGKYLKIKAEIKTISSLSAHADQDELLDWISSIQNHPEKVFIVHGEPQASYDLALKITTKKGWKTVVPILNSSFNLGTMKIKKRIKLIYENNAQNFGEIHAGSTKME